MRVGEAIEVLRHLPYSMEIPDSLARQIRELYDEEEITVMHCDENNNCYPIQVKRRNSFSYATEKED